MRDNALLAAMGTILIAANVCTMTLLMEANDTIEMLRTSLDMAEADREEASSEKPCDDSEYAGLVQCGTSTTANHNRNYLNIKRLNKGDWLGQTGHDAKGHVQFTHPEYGVRAAAHVLTAYYVKHDCDTIRKIVTRFSKTEHKAYISFLCKKMNLKPDQKFMVLARLPELLRNMAKFESGHWLPERMFVGYDLASAAYKLGRDARK